MNQADPLLKIPLRYDWPEIKLMYVAGASAADIARALTQTQPDAFRRVQNTILQACGRGEWNKLREKAVKLTESRPEGSKNNVSTLSPPSSTNVIAMAQNILSARKNKYLDVMTEAIERGSLAVKRASLDTLEDVAMTFKLAEPMHAIAKDVHGLNAKDSVQAMQVNFLSDFAGALPMPVKSTNQALDT